MRVSTNQYQQISLNALLDQQSKLSRVQEQLATGRRILQPSDDPAGSARALELAKSIETIEKYSANADFAESRMRIEEGVINEVETVITRVRELAVQAANASQTAEDREKIGAEVGERLDQLMRLANSTDGNGEYLFSGLKTRTQPFVRQDGDFVYQGDQGVRRTQVGPGRTTVTTHSGFETFMDIPNGNGEWVAEAAAGNEGTGVIGDVTVTDAAETTNAPYDIRFAENASGESVYYVTDGDGALVSPDPASLPSPPGPPPSPLPDPPPAYVIDNAATFEPGDVIELDGLSVQIQGQPASGDGFRVEASRSQSLFDTVRGFEAALNGAGDTPRERAAFRNTANRTLLDLDQALENMLNVRAQIGGRLSGLESERNANETAVLELKTTKSEIEDLDYAEAATRLNLRLTGLQAAQQSYSRIQGLSLFNFL